jgi:hypothetical protein
MTSLRENQKIKGKNKAGVLFYLKPSQKWFDCYFKFRLSGVRDRASFLLENEFPCLPNKRRKVRWDPTH